MEIAALKNKESITITHTFDQVWLCRYPCPVDCLHDNGTEFVSTEFQELLQSYGIRSKLTTVKNPQANGILKWTHQVIPHCSRPRHCLCPTRTSHACYVGHQYNIPYNLKGKPSSTCFQPWHDSSDFLRHQLVSHQPPQTSPISIRCWCQKPQIHSTQILPQWQSPHLLWHWKSIFGKTGQTCTRPFQNYQRTTTTNQWYHSYPAIADFCWAHQHLPIAAIFWTLQLRMRMSYLGHYDPFAYSHLIQDIQQMSHDPRLKKIAPKTLEDFRFAHFSQKPISFTWQPQKSL